MNKGATKIDRIHVFGMRCSGTNHLIKVLQKNIRDIPPEHIAGNVIGWKHDDLWSPSGYSNDDNTEMIFDSRPSPTTIYSSLMVVIYRSPLAWLRALHYYPHHAPKMVGIDFGDFLRRPFESFYSPIGDDLSEDEQKRLACVRSDRLIHYYPDVFTLRYTIMDIFESFKYRAPNVCYINLESLESNPQAVLKYIAEHYGLSIHEEFKPDQADKHSAQTYQPKFYRPMSIADLAYVLRKTKLGREKEIGYGLRLTSQLPRLIGAEAPQMQNIFTNHGSVRLYSYERGSRSLSVY